MTPSLHSYAVATRRRGQQLHVQEDGKPAALCGRRTVAFIGEPGQPYDESWPWCPDCVERAKAIAPDLMDDWFASHD